MKNVKAKLNEYLLKVAELNDAPLYHVTYYSKLPAISSSGLQPNHQRSIGGGGYDAHSKGRIFLTEEDGIHFWFSKAEDFAEHNSDNPFEAGLVPVVLRVDIAGIEHDLEEDEPGTTDAMVDAWIASHGISPEYLDVYNGSSWVNVENWDTINPAESFDIDESEEEPLYYFKTKNPLEP